MPRDEPIHLDLLGRFCLRRGGREIRLPAGKSMLVLAFLACARQRTGRRDRLAALLWQDADSEQARASLRQALSRLRSALGEARAAVWSDNEQIALTGDRWRIDIDALAACDGRDPDAVNPAWAATFLAGVHRRDPSVDAWLESERQRHLRAVTQVFSTAIDAALDAGDAARAFELGMRLTALDPYLETAHRSLMLAYQQQGDRAGALRQYRTLVRLLDQGLGVAPDPASRALYQRLRRLPTAQQVSVAANARAREAVRRESGAAMQGLRLVAVLAVRHDQAPPAGGRPAALETLVRQYGGEAVLSHGAEALYVFGLDGASTAGAEGAFRVALRVRDAGPDGNRPACGCASGLVGLDDRACPVGAVVQRAARLALLAEAGDVVIDRAVRSQVAARLRVDEVTLRSEPAYRVLGAEFDPFDDSHELFGRRAELAQLEQLFDDAGRHGAALALVSGDAGMGKTHLVRSLELTARAGRRAVVRLAFSPHEASPAGLVVRLARGLSDTLIEFGVDVTLDEVQQSTLRRLSEKRAGGADPPRRDDEHRRHVDLLRAQLARLGEVTPVLLVAEDCHWASPSDLDLLIDLIDALSGLPLMLVATERRENEALGARLQSRLVEVPVICLTLTPLSRRDAEALVRRRVDDAAACRRILDRAGGHPLFLAQLAESDLEPDDPVPVSVVALVQNALDRAAPAARQACLRAAVLGSELSLATLESVFPDLERADLPRSRLLRVHGDRLSFRHTLIHEAVYALLAPAERAALHRLAALHFRADNPGDYAHHALRCGDPAVALDACCAAAVWLLDDNRLDEAESIVDSGLALEPVGDQRAQLLLCRSQVMRDRGELASAVAACRHARDCAVDAALQVRALVGAARLLKRRNDIERAAAQLREASRVAHAAPSVPDPVLAELEHEWGNNMFMQGLADHCLAHHQRARRLAESHGDARMQAAALGGLGDAYYAAGKLRLARRYFARCVAQAEAAGLTAIALAHRPMAAFVANLLDPGPDNVDALRHAADQARRWHNVQYEMLARAALAEMLLHAYDLAGVDAQMRRLDDLQARFGGRRFEPDIRYVDAMRRWAGGDAAEGRRLLRDAAREFGADAYMGPSYQGALAMLCYDQPIAGRALAAGEALLQRGSAAHNRVAFALFASACYWRRGERGRARALVERARRDFASEPVGQLDACLAWMRTLAEGGAGAADAARALRRRALGLLVVSHCDAGPARIAPAGSTAAAPAARR